MRVVIVVAGMEGALPSVVGGPRAGRGDRAADLGGLRRRGGRARRAALRRSQAARPGVLTVNIDNGYGAACAALRILRALPRTGER